MTDTEVNQEALARQIADRGREALLERMRTAYADAASAHADLISLDQERIETMAQAAAARADGLQWRRALAGVAAQELGMSVAEALSHPAVAQAQALVGAPSYEQSLAELIAQPLPAPEPVEAAATPEPEPAATPEHSAAPESAATWEPAASPEPTATWERDETPAPTATWEHIATPEHTASPEATPPPEPTATHDDLPRTVEHETIPAGSDEAEVLETVQVDDVQVELLPEPDPSEYLADAYEPEIDAGESPAVADEHTPDAAEAPPLAYEAEPDGYATQAYEPAPSNHWEAPRVDPDPYSPAEPTGEQLEDDQLQVAMIHLGGVAGLPTKRPGLYLRLSVDGLDILRSEHDIIGRLVWDEIESLEVPPVRTRRRQRETHARLVVRTPQGDASFDIPDEDAGALRDRVQSLLQRYGRH